MRSRRSHFPILILALFFALPGAASAATLSVTPVASHVMAGNIVTVRVLVSSVGQSINNAEATLSFPSAFLKVLSIDTSSSIFPLWIQAPVFSNVNGTVTFNGGVPSPGFMGSAGTIALVTFQAKKSGTATLSLGDASVLANDGLGTDVLQSTNDATLTIQNAPEAPAPTVVVEEATTTASTSPDIATTTPPTVVASLAPTEEQRVGGFNVTALFVSEVLGVLVLLLLGATLYMLRQLRTVEKAIERGVVKSEKDLHKGFSLLKEDLEQHVRQLRATRGETARLTEEKTLESDVERDVADLEQFVAQDLEVLRKEK